MRNDQSKTVLLEVKTLGRVYQATIKARLWTTIFQPSLTKRGAITAANNFIRTHKLKVANKNKVSKNYYNVREI